MNIDKLLAEFRRYNKQHQAQAKPGRPIEPRHREEAALQEVSPRYRAEAKVWDAALRELSVQIPKALVRRGIRTRPSGRRLWHQVAT